MNITSQTPQGIFRQLSKTVSGQDGYLKSLSTAAWVHLLKYRLYINGLQDPSGRPKQNLLVIGGPGTGKTLSIQTLGRILDLPVIIEDATQLSGEGWRGRSISSIIPNIFEATEDEEKRPFSIVCFDEIDKVFKSGRSNFGSVGSSGFLPLNNLLTFLNGGVISCQENKYTYTLDTSNLLVILLGAFEGLDEIIEKRLSGGRQIGFCGSGDSEPADGDILQHVTEADLHEFGISWELLGRISLISGTRPLSAADYKKILKESDMSPVSQFDSLLSLASDIRVSITDDATDYIAQKAAQSREGARMLARMVSETLQPVVFDIPNDRSISEISIDCGNSGLLVRKKYERPAVYQDWYDEEDLSVFTDPDIPDTPF